MANPPSSAEIKQRQKDEKVRLREARKAEKIRRKNSTDPADMGRIRQIVQAYKITHEFDKPLPWLLLASFLVPLIVLGVIGYFAHMLVWFLILGIMVGMLAAMLMLIRRTKKATFARYAGQAGSAEVALSMLPKTWISAPVITLNRQQDVVHRAVGPGGIVLVGEGEAGRVRQLLASEQKKHEKVAYGVKVSTVVMGDKPSQVPLNRLTEHIKKMPKVLEAHQVTDVNSRLKALDAVRPKVPVPRGPMPTNVRGARQAMRGR